MIYDLARTERLHLAIKKETSAGAYQPMRKCTGACNRRRSLGQFVGQSTVCIRCVRRAT
jgi:hypothetical protein